MINLLPTQEKKNLRTLYLFRAWTTFLWMVFFLGLSGIILLIPSFVMSSFKEGISKNKIENLQKRENFNLDKESQSFVSDINTKIDAVSPFLKNKMEASDVFGKILENKNSNIKIRAIYYDLGQDGSVTARVSGTSSTRESLIQFLKKLDEQKIFAKIDLPVSNFVKNKDLEFDFNLKVINKI